MPQPRITVVVPTLNEEGSLRQHLPHVLSLVRASDRVIVSDGGSTDGTVALAEEMRALVVTGPPGRGVQLNAGAAVALAEGVDALLFLHADTRLEAAGLEAMRRTIGEGAAGGGFFVRFANERSIFALGTRIVNLRTRLTKCPLGDQAQFVTRTAFEALGGYRDWPILEDLDFARRLKRLGRPALLEPAVSTSARRFVKRGITLTIVTNWLIWLLYFLGVSPHRLAWLYRNIR